MKNIIIAVTLLAAFTASAGNIYRVTCSCGATNDYRNPSKIESSTTEAVDGVRTVTTTRTYICPSCKESSCSTSTQRVRDVVVTVKVDEAATARTQSTRSAGKISDTVK